MPGLSVGGPGRTSGSSTSSNRGTRFLFAADSPASRSFCTSTSSPNTSCGKTSWLHWFRRYISQPILKHPLTLHKVAKKQQKKHTTQDCVYTVRVRLTFSSLLRFFSTVPLLPREFLLSSSASKSLSTKLPAESSRNGLSWSETHRKPRHIIRNLTLSSSST